MRKYLYILKTELMSNLQYVFNLFGSFIIWFIIIYIFLNLWQYIYSDPNELINGYSMNQMIWYVIITEILWSIIGGRKLCRKISDDVRSGNIAYNINKPYNYIGYSLANHFGLVTVRAIIYIVLGMLTGFIFLKSFPSLNIITVLAVLLTGFLATIINTLIIIFIGLFSFIIEDSNPFYWLYSKVILILGTIFPIEFFPRIMQKIISFSPIYVVSYGPARLFVNFSWNEFLKISIAQIMYIAISYGLCAMVYRKGVKKLNVNGG